LLASGQVLFETAMLSTSALAEEDVYITDINPDLQVECLPE
jgi:hypothetical protein